MMTKKNSQTQLFKSRYIRLHIPDYPFSDSQGYVYEQRLVYESYYGCCVLPWVIIHHKNENRLDNRIENLLLTTRGNHNIIHKVTDHSKTICSNCGFDKTYIRKHNGRPNWFIGNNGYLCMRCYDKNI